MTTVPAIYGDLTASQLATWQDWQDWIIEKAEHVVDCPAGCDLMMVRCPAGMLFAEAERTAWERWHAARTATVPR